jgi:chromosome segregation ATPase
MPGYDLEKRRKEGRSYDVSPDEEKLPDPNRERSRSKTVSRTEARGQARERLYDQLLEGMDLDITPPSEDEELEELTRRLEATREKAEGHADEERHLKDKADAAAEEAKEELLDLQAKADMGEATEAEVKDAEEALQEAKSDLQDAKEALQAAKGEEIRLRRQAQLLDERLTEARQKAQMRFERQVREAISGQATEVVKALEAARRETERLYALVNRLPTSDLNLRSPQWGRLPMGTRVGGAVNKGRWEKAVKSLGGLGAEVPDYETEEYVDPFTDSEQQS